MTSEAAAEPAPTDPVPADEEKKSRAGRNLPAAIGVGVGLVAVVLASLFVVKDVFVAVVVIALGIGLYELARAFATVGIRIPLLPVLTGGTIMLIGGFYGGMETAAIAMALTVIGTLVWRLAEGADGFVRDTSAGIFALSYLFLMGVFVMLMLLEDDGPWRIVAFIVATIASDIGGYIAGVLFGKHPMAPTISPKKSWEGFAGSLIVGIAAGIGTVVYGLDGHWWAGVILGIAGVVFATLGDLSESLIKRDLGIKDMGDLLPGHGGIMDRLDSLIAVAPIAWLILHTLVPVSSARAMTALRDYSAAVTQPTLTSDLNRYDEVVAPDGSLRTAWTGLAESAISLTEGDLLRVSGDIQRFLADDGVTYTPSDETPGPWRLDPLPLVIDAAEWAPLEVGLAQRTELLNAILVDLYGPQRLLSSGLLPATVVFGHQGFLRVAARASAGDEWPLLLAAADLGRNAAGEWQVIADRAQAPSGIGFAMENRRVISRVMPDLYRRAGIHRMAPFFQALRSTLMEAAPSDRPDPRVVVLSPGTHSETAYDQAFVASSLGFPLVEGSDLVMRDGAVWMRVFGRLERVDVILRRVDAAWSDALELRKNSQLGVAGLSEAIRRGSVRVVNGLGAGVLENPALLPFMSEMCEMLLDEPLRLPSVQTYWCGDARARAYVDDNIGDLVIRAIDNPLDLDHLPTSDLRDMIAAEPHRFVGQEPLPLSQAPTLGAHGVRSQTLSLRTFTLRYGSTYRPLIGGLANVFEAGQATSSKDVWVLKDRPEDADQGLADVLSMTNVRAPAAMVPRVLEDMFWFGRYSERAEDMLRLILSAHASAEDFRARPHTSGGATLAVLMGAVRRLSGAPFAVDQLDEDFRSVLLDTHRPGSVAHSLSALRDAAQSVRDQLSPDTWQAFSSTDRATGALRTYAYSHQVAESAGRMLTGVLSLQGVTANMIRDPGWRMIGAGRSVERGLQLCHLLHATTTIRRGVDIDRDLHNSVLSVAESAVTHRRRYRGYVRLPGILDLLLLDADNPRSLAFGVAELREHLAAMPDSTGSTRPERLLDDLAEELERVDIAALTAVEGESRPNLERFLEGYIGQLTRLADAIGELHFAAGPLPRSFGLAPAVTA